MSLIGNTYIDNLNIPESTSYEGWFGIGGVILGFGLTFFYDLYKSNKDVNRVGESLEAGVLELKTKIIQQYEYIEKHLDDLKQNKIEPLGITIVHEENPFKQIDKLILYKFYDKLKNKKEREKFFNHNGKVDSKVIHNKISKSFNEIDLVYIETKNLHDYTNLFSLETRIIYKSYLLEYNKLGRILFDYQVQVGEESFIKDPFSRYISELIKTRSGLGVTIDNLASLKEQLHDILFPNNVNFNHPLYRAISEFDSKGINLIYEIKALYQEQFEKVDFIKVSLGDRFLALYDQDIKTLVIPFNTTKN